MTIASEITRIKTNIDNAYTALEAKGATIPETKNSANLADTINTITDGSGETNYLGRIVTEDGVLQFPYEGFAFSLPSDVTSIGAYGLQYAFYNCLNLTSAGLDNVTSIDRGGLQYAFQYCIGLTSLSFPALNSNSFGGYTNQFNNMLRGVTGCTVHFPSNLESVIGSWSDVTNGFGGTNTTVLFDLPATS